MTRTTDPRIPSPLRRSPEPVPPASLSRRSLLAAAAALPASALLAACGGGGDAGDGGGAGAGAPPAATGGYTEGTVSGFGSVIVAGVAYDDSAATVVDDDGNVVAASALALGMTVEIDHSRLDRALGTALALRIRIGTEVKGPVEALDTAASTMTVLGQTVLVTTSTSFDTTLAGGLAALDIGRIVEVYGILDPDNRRIVATRIEAEDVAVSYKLRGRIEALDTGAMTFAINGAVISYASLPAAQVPPGLANNQLVRVRLHNVPDGNGVWQATALRGGRRWPDSIVEARIEGLVTAFASATSFSVNGLPVDASTARFPDGTDGIRLGARVEVSGRIEGGVMRASEVELEERRFPGPRQWELRGEIANFDAAAGTFALRGVTVAFTPAVDVRGGTVASLGNGLRVRVRGVLAEDRTRLEALRIDIR